MQGPKALAVYVTSHGFGHLNRAVAAINRVPEDVPVVIRSAPDLFEHWRDRLSRPAALEPHVSDAGAVNPPGNSADTDGPATLRRAAEIHASALDQIDEYTDELRDGTVGAVLCDATPVPLVAAKRAGVPGFLLANFAWSEIYEPLAMTLGGDWPRFVEEIREAYRHATAIFRCAPHLSLERLAPLIDVGMVVTPARDRRGELRSMLGLTDSDKIIYLYLGRYGQDDYEWCRLAALADRGVHFVAFHGAPESAGAVSNLHVVRSTAWNGADLAASSDVVVAKAGYGTVSEAMAAGTPLIYPPRTGFAEFHALTSALNAWGGGVPVSRQAFDRLRIEDRIDHALALRPGPPPFPTDGAARVADHLTAVCRGGSAVEKHFERK